MGELVGTDVASRGQLVNQAAQRRSPRLKLQVPIFLRGADASGVEFIELTKTVNISATGACIASSHLLKADQVVHLTIPAPFPAISSVLPSETPPISARLRRQEAIGDLRLLGLEFLKPLE
jgi:hypothetical protein